MCLSLHRTSYTEGYKKNVSALPGNSLNSRIVLFNVLRIPRKFAIKNFCKQTRFSTNYTVHILLAIGVQKMGRGCWVVLGGGTPPTLLNRVHTVVPSPPPDLCDPSVWVKVGRTAGSIDWPGQNGIEGPTACYGQNVYKIINNVKFDNNLISNANGLFYMLGVLRPIDSYGRFGAKR